MILLSPRVSQDALARFTCAVHLRRIPRSDTFERMKFVIRLVRLVFGLFLYALGIALTIQAHIGYAPWDIFHAGVAKLAGIQLGTASIAAGIVIVALTVLLGEKIGLGTILNMVLIGLFLNAIFALDIIPLAFSVPAGIGMLVAGLFVIALASYFYIGSGFGAGPRDSLMIALRRLTKIPIGICRAVIEGTVLLAGWALGGLFGFGTVLSAIATGFCIELTFTLLRFDVTEVCHETLAETIQRFRK